MGLRVMIMSMRHEQKYGKRPLTVKAFLLVGACSVSGDHELSHIAAAFAPSPPSCRRHRCPVPANASRTRAKTRHRPLGFKRLRTPDPLVTDSSSDTAHHADHADHADHATAKPNPSFGLLPDFMQKDPLLVTKERWKENSTPTESATEASSPASDRRDTEMMVMSVASLVLAVGVVYALASSTPDMFRPNDITNDIKESENIVQNLLREGNAERLELATRTIVGQVLPQSAEDVLAVTIGEGISGVIGAVATWLVGKGLSIRSKEDLFGSSLPTNEAWKVSGWESKNREKAGRTLAVRKNVDSLVSETVANGDYFLTQAAAQPVLEAVGIPAFVSSLVSVLIATLPYEAVKFNARKRQSYIEEDMLLNMLLEEEENRKKDMTVMDKMSNRMSEFIQQLNVRQTVEGEVEDEPEEDIELERIQQPPEVPAFDFIELFADITKWLEYDVLTSNYKGVLTLPNGEMLTSGWESAIFGLLAALSSQLYTDVLYLYSDFGNPLKRERTINRSLKEWASIYATKSITVATLFGVYETVREPSSRLVSQLVSGGIGGCRGSQNIDLCVQTFLADNPPDATIQAEFRAFVVSAMNWADSFSWLSPLNDQETLGSFVRGEVVSLSSVLARLFDM